MKKIFDYNTFINEFYEHDKDKVAANKIIPPAYVYHISSKENRNDIMRYGLKPSVGESYSSWSKTKNSIPAIFATIAKNSYELTGGFKDFKLYSDIWKINTKLINNEWFVDKHFEFPNEFKIQNPNIVTFEPISTDALTLE